MRALMPFTGPTTLRREMDRIFDRLWDNDAVELQGRGEWDPLLDFSETKDGFTAKLDLPGLDPKDVQVTVQHGTLTVKGEKKREKEEKEERFYRMERSYGAFARSFQLPAAVDEARVQATFRNGVLNIWLPKSAESRGTNIPIQA